MRAIVNRWAPLLLIVIAACADASKERLESARGTWRAAAVADYSFRYRTTGFSAHVDIRVTVVSGVVTDVERLDGGPEANTEGAPTIDSLFAAIGFALDGGEVHVHVDYDAALGYPVSVSFDNGQEAAGFEVSELTRSR